MEKSKSGNDNEAKIGKGSASDENPNNLAEAAVEEERSALDVVVNGTSQSSTGTPFTDLSQIDADFVLARTLQEQERVYMMLSMNGNGSDYGSWEAESHSDEDDDDHFDHPSGDYTGTDVEDDEKEDEDAFDVHAHDQDGEDDDTDIELDPASFPNDEAYARALQDAEDREMAARLLALAGINDRVVEEMEDHGSNSEDTWDEVDPDELSYEELLALSEVVGTESRGLSADKIASLPLVNYKTGNACDGSCDSCVICCLDYEEGDALTVLSCKHSYHSECINSWLQINKVCPVCSTEVSPSGNS